MLRRDFLGRGAIAVAGGLLVGDAALEAFERLTHVRKSFPSADIGWQAGEGRYGGRYSSVDIWERLPNGLYSHRREVTPSDKNAWGSVIHYWDGPLPFVVQMRDGAVLDKVVQSSHHHSYSFSAFGST